MKRLIKKASYYMILHTCTARNGSPIEFAARLLTNKLQYSIIMINQYNNSSFYDGNSFDDAFDLYITIISRLYSVTFAEQVMKQKQTFLFKAQKLLTEAANDIYHKRNTLYFKKPLFLGISEGC